MLLWTLTGLRASGCQLASHLSLFFKVGKYYLASREHGLPTFNSFSTIRSKRPLSFLHVRVVALIHILNRGSSIVRTYFCRFHSLQGSYYALYVTRQSNHGVILRIGSGWCSFRDLSYTSLFLCAVAIGAKVRLLRPQRNVATQGGAIFYRGARTKHFRFFLWLCGSFNGYPFTIRRIFSHVFWRRTGTHDLFTISRLFWVPRVRNLLSSNGSVHSRNFWFWPLQLVFTRNSTPMVPTFYNAIFVFFRSPIAI